jgi:hypothetical protein
MFEIGIKIVCINDQFDPSVGIRDVFSEFPAKGSIYTVRDVVPGIQFDKKETCAILLSEIISKPNRFGIEPGWDWTRFREIEPLEQENMEKSVALIEAIMQEST